MCIEEIKKSLEKIAFQKTTAYCYTCQKDAPSGFCDFCHSDDLMRRSQNGVEFGVDWVIQELLKEHLNPIDCDEVFESSVSENYGSVKVAWIHFDPSSVIKTMDPISWRIAQHEHFDSLEADEQIVSFDNGSSYYWTDDVARFVEENLGEEGVA